MRIALTGAGGTGKGTLMTSIKEEVQKQLGKNLHIIPSNVQKLTTLLYPFSANYNDLNDFELYQKQNITLFAQISTEDVIGDNYICERSALDFLPYYIQAHNKAEDKTLFSEKHLIIYTNHVLTHTITQYDILIYLPIEFENTQEDKDRNCWKERDPQCRANTDRILREYIQIIRSIKDDYVKSPIIMTVTGSVAERTEQVLHIIRNLYVKAGFARPL